MGHIEWNDSMLVGVPEIDVQHQELTSIINRLSKAYLAGEDKTIIAEIISRINDYAHYHFETEEAFMKEFGAQYPGLDRHLEAHSGFFDKVIGFLLDYVDDKDDITTELLDYLTDWWVGHICGIDRELGRFINQHTPAP